ncbi:HpcH/HpaI aldolase/citrate lyase family protein [Xenorhabdus bovienii]|uniref:HpcH/HpaI aldolase/citrate lyase family protein n=1 Tax=Xenorhabdus bovienii TaxID=40576 RepID=A0AAJ1MWU6_XENBV|nr:HpcH/HpaI aldolase/citrate lyase family protein [Xenorhabdus bovienii]MDE1476694.1 HpcH/HpaI aldolase/citrate lyase family protein [Xenorhabdus bovienii]MDE1485957.1 HpcH/HpaI aldolase/citrate lyase family protein [Xenorhabdus bovienii]MDE1489331.1 HpcH/HpaI aldolase/citrate lyase family protein [Xenorhabdus bovienii]MDE1494277.1 HpcH/HpaI aldolase/citrate lyase family protein [Xenorhabdus bovienii]MDE9472499.1 HpcH/HpaI aldolase/citrate lyase family protein [Xenorhabdus bovienii]
MKPIPSPHQLGATLYIPATRQGIAEIVLHNKIPGLRSLVICLEDAVSDQDIPAAIENLGCVLQTLAGANISSSHTERHYPLIFIRPRNEEMGRYLVDNVNLSAVDGLVLPKFTRASLAGWWDIVGSTHLSMMPTLETEEVFDAQQMNQLADSLKAHPCYKRIIALRIGGNDLMNVISLRRSRDFTLYEGPMGYVIKMLVTIFAARGFSLTAPVCEHIDDLRLLEKELVLDIAHGLVGKTAIHPGQIEYIQRALMVNGHDYADALRILNSSQAVFKSQGTMCEPATHRRWAVNILDRAKYYGIAPEFNEETCKTFNLF